MGCSCVREITRPLAKAAQVVNQLGRELSSIGSSSGVDRSVGRHEPAIEIADADQVRSETGERTGSP
jgi:hypothetical protein